MVSLLRRRTPAAVRLLRAHESERVPQTGAVGSVQEAEVEVPREALERLWRPEYLERLAAAYWRHITRATLGLVRVEYGPGSRALVLRPTRLALLRFRAPEYETGSGFGSVTWRIESGLLVAKRGRGSGMLRILTWRLPEPDGSARARLRVRLEVRSFYPLLRGSGRFARLGAWIYAQTQLRVHVAVCNSFLRSLADLDLPPSEVGSLRATAAGTEGQ
ncbi:MAG: hypothetical protein ACJ75R_04820 [Solirubrobacterales bacterium]